MKSYKKLFNTIGAIFLIGVTSLFATGQSAKDILDKAYNYIGSMDKYAFQAVVLEEEIENGAVYNTYRHDISVKVDRPHKLRVDTIGDITDRSSFINNGHFTMLDYGFGYYGQLETPETINGALDFIFEKYGIRAPLAQLVYSDMNKRVKDLKFKKSKYFGTMNVDGTLCDYVAFSNDTGEIHLWIETGDKPLVKNYSIVYKDGEGKPRINTSIIWDNNLKILDSDFVFKKPKGALKLSIESANN